MITHLLSLTFIVNSRVSENLQIMVVAAKFVNCAYVSAPLI